MLKLTTSAGVFGPFHAVDALDDRYRCDGADLPFAVIGDDGVIGEWDLPTPTPTPPPTPVPQVVGMAQARLALLAAGHLAAVDPLIDALSEPQRSAARIEWEYRSEVRRSSALVAQIGAALGLSDEQIDALFVAAAAL